MPVTKISDQCLADFLAEDLTQTQIAKACNISRQAIHARINYVKAPQHKQRMMRHFSVRFLRRIGFSIPEIAIYTDYCAETIRRLLYQYGYRAKEPVYSVYINSYVPQTMRLFLIQFLYRLGFVVEDIAELTQYSPLTVIHYLYKSGYSLSGRLK